MKWTFGIITNGKALSNIRKIHDSIMRQNIDDEFEVIVVGGLDPRMEKVRHIPFDETRKNAWITKKKNIIAQLSKYENICMIHDYVVFFDGWYEGYKNFNQEWDVCMNPIVNRDGQRFRDWITCQAWCEEGKIIYLNYDVEDRTSQMYVSGTYFCVKKRFMLENPFDESLSWGQGEDVKWSNSLRQNWRYKCNKYSKVGLLKKKQNDHWFDPINIPRRESWDSKEYLEIWKRYND
jgi:hypothetical protein